VKAFSPRVISPRAYDHHQGRIDHPDAKAVVSMEESAMGREVNLKRQGDSVAPTAQGRGRIMNENVRD